MNPIIVTYLFDSPLDKVWNALSQEAELKKWYFPVRNYQFTVGEEFSFYESEDSHKFFHQCIFLNIKPKQVIEYSWAHPEQSTGKSVVKWEMNVEGQKTRVTLTHTGVENFADAGDTFSVANFEMGWNAIVKNMLRNYLYGIRKLKFDIEINATPIKVWKKLWEKDNYTLWTQPFCPGTYYTGEVKQGERIHFLSPSGEGMYSDIAFCKENELMIFKHIGMVKDKMELPLNNETERWTGSFESYKLTEMEGGTHLHVEVDAIEDYYDYMSRTFPLALSKLKAMAEEIIKS